MILKDSLYILIQMLIGKPCSLLLLIFATASATIAGDYKEVVIKVQQGVTLFDSQEKNVGSNDESLNELLTRHSVKDFKKVFREEASNEITLEGYYVLNYGGENTFGQYLDDLDNNSAVLWAEPNYIFKLHHIPNDSLYELQWALKKIDMSTAWDIERGDPQIIVGVIDTGIDYDHEDLRGQLWINHPEDHNQNGKLDPGDENGADDDGNGYVDDVIGWDFTDAPSFPDHGDYLEPDNDPMDEFQNGHGTPISGIIAAATDNHKGMAGIAPEVRIMTLRAGTASGFLEEDDVAEAIVYGVQNGCRIINMSFGDAAYSHLIKDAVEYGSGQNVIFVASSGNSGNNILQFPAGYDETISVGAITSQNNLASFSSFGSKLDVVAPGVDLFSVLIGNLYGELSGTSFSAPVVSGLLALLWSNNPEESAPEIKSRLISGCTDLGNRGWDEFYGHGLVNAYQSLITEQSAYAQISKPASQTGLQEDNIAIIGTAYSSDLKHYTLSFAAGENPVNLNTFKQTSKQVINDTLGFWETSQLVDSVYTIELKILNRDNSSRLQRVIVYLDRTPAVNDSTNVLPMMVKNYYGYLIYAHTDDLTTAVLHYRRIGDLNFNYSKISPYSANEHYFVLTQEDIRDEIEFYPEFINTSGFITEGDVGHLDLINTRPLTADFQKLQEISGSGYFFPEAVKFDPYGSLNIIGLFSRTNQTASLISILNYDNGIITTHEGPIAAFPRDIVDVDGDSLPELFAGYGGNSFLFPGEALPEFTAPPVQSALTDFWLGLVEDFDMDSQYEIAAIHQNQWSIFSLLNKISFEVSFEQVLENPTGGDNFYGVPYARYSDLDDDGKSELIIGDYDGDIIGYELNSANNFEPAYTIELPGTDATHLFCTGDFDGDLIDELAIATMNVPEYVGESSKIQYYWIITILKSLSDNSFEKVWRQNFHGITNLKNTFDGITASDYDADGIDEIFFTPYPRAYYIQFIDGEYQIDWFLDNLNSNAVPDLENYQLLLTEKSSSGIWQLMDKNQRPLRPSFGQVKSADSSHIQLQWNPVNDSLTYRIFRENLSSHTIDTFATHQAFYLDQTVSAGMLYSYRLQSIDSSFSIPYSSLSEPIVIRAENPPVFLNMEILSLSQLFLTFSKVLGQKSFQPDYYMVEPDRVKPVSVIKGQGGKQVILSFQNPFTPGLKELVLHNLTNQYRVAFYTDSLRLPFNVEVPNEAPYLEEISMISKKKLLLVFNHPMNAASAMDISNYKIFPDDRVMEAEFDSKDPAKIHLQLTGQNRMGALGVDYYIEIDNLKDIWGHPMSEEIGNRFLISRRIDDLSELVVFPNPFRMNAEKGSFHFGNVPNGCKIDIFTSNGKKVIRLKEEDFNGGVPWNFKNQSGEIVESGVYIYLAQYKNNKKLGKIMFIR